MGVPWAAQSDAQSRRMSRLPHAPAGELWLASAKASDSQVGLQTHLMAALSMKAKA